MTADATKLIAAAYARKSNEQDGREDDAKSVTRQVERAREFAAKKGWQFSEEHIYIDDAVSGAEWSERERRAWFAMKRAIGAGDASAGKPPFDVLIVANQSRIGRDAQRVPYEITQVEECDVTIWSYLDGKRITVLDETGEIEVAIKGIADSFQRRAASKFSMDELKRRAAAGKVASGKIYGYSNVRPHPVAAVERVVDTRAGQGRREDLGAGRRGVGLRSRRRLPQRAEDRGPEDAWREGAGAAARAGHRARAPEVDPQWCARAGQARPRGAVRTRPVCVGPVEAVAEEGLEAPPSARDRWREHHRGTARRLEDRRPDLVRRAHERIAAYNATALRAGVGNGKAKTQFVAKPEKRGSYLLSNFLKCGARTPQGKTCSAPMTVTVRGKKGKRAYACSRTGRTRGPARTAVPWPSTSWTRR